MKTDTEAPNPPKFYTKTTTATKVGNDKYYDWQEAIDAAYASATDKTITVLQNSVMEDNYTIPDGVTLLGTFNAAGDCYTENQRA